MPDGRVACSAERLRTINFRFVRALTVSQCSQNSSFKNSISVYRRLSRERGQPVYPKKVHKLTASSHIAERSVKTVVTLTINK